MTAPPVPMCSHCKHFRGPWKCTAFLERIPQEIIGSDHDHRRPHPGDHGIRFEPINNDAAAIVDDLFREETT